MMKRYTVPLVDLEPCDRHVNQEGMIPADARTAAAIAVFLRSCDVDAVGSDDGAAVAFPARSERAASRIAFGAVCHLASENYRAEAAWWIANRDSRSIARQA
jgi:hypothetical protein